MNVEFEENNKFKVKQIKSKRAELESEVQLLEKLTHNRRNKSLI